MRDFKRKRKKDKKEEICVNKNVAIVLIEILEVKRV